MSENLKPCRWCGGPATEVGVRVACYTTGCQVADAGVFKAEEWNRRAPLTVAMTVQEVRALVDAIHQCAPGLGKRHAVRVALAPFLAAMEGES